MTFGRGVPTCPRCGPPLPCDRCGGPIVVDWVHAHGDDRDRPTWWHDRCWAVLMRSLDRFTEGVT